MAKPLSSTQPHIYYLATSCRGGLQIFFSGDRGDVESDLGVGLFKNIKVSKLKAKKGQFYRTNLQKLLQIPTIRLPKIKKTTLVETLIKLN